MGSGKPLKREESKAGATATRAQAGPSSSSPAAITVDGEDEDESLRHSDTLCREQVLRRRCRRLRLRQLHRIYRSQYWALLEELRAKHRGFYWEYGIIPFEEDQDEMEEGGGGKRRRIEAGGNRDMAPLIGSSEGAEESRSGVGGGAALGLAEKEDIFAKKEERKRCAYNTCMAKAMPFTSYCHRIS